MAIKQINVLGTTHDVHDARVGGIDSAPTSGSGNLVTSGGVYTAIQNAGGGGAVDDPYYGLMGFIGDGVGESQTTADHYQELISKEFIYDDDSGYTFQKVQSISSGILDDVLNTYHAVSLDWVGISVGGSRSFPYALTPDAYLFFFIDGDGDYYYYEYER